MSRKEPDMYCGPTPGTCGRKETCLDSLCEGHPSKDFGGGREFNTRLHRCTSDAPIESPEQSMGRAYAWMAWIGAALIFGWAAAIVIFNLKGAS